MNIIYGLRDPRNDVYQYIGKSTIGMERPLMHLLKSHSKLVNNWISELRNSGYSPIIDIIEVVEELNDLPTREKHWVKYFYRINPNLLNSQMIIKPIEEVRTNKTDDEFELFVSLFNTIGKILKRERIFRDINQEELSEISNVSRTTIARLENNTGNIGMNSISSIIKALLSKERVTNIVRLRAVKRK